MSVTVSIGADPEFFLLKDDMNVSAHGLVPGTKSKPHKVKCGAVQLDGTAVEFNIDPAATAFEFEYNIHTVLGEVRKMIPKEYKFEFKPSVTYKKGYFDKEVPESSKELGCDPDFDAIKFNPRIPNSPPPVEMYSTLRTGAGHIHIGFTKDKEVFDDSHFWDCVLLSKNMNAVMKPLSTHWDTDKRRQCLYGNGAAFRPKPYGVEYRSLSNAWLNYPKLWPWLFDMSKAIFIKTLEDDKTSIRAFRYYNTVFGDPCIKKTTQMLAKYGFPAMPEGWKEIN